MLVGLPEGVFIELPSPYALVDTLYKARKNRETRRVFPFENGHVESHAASTNLGFI